jgi:hypothetical protein
LVAAGRGHQGGRLKSSANFFHAPDSALKGNINVSKLKTIILY